MKRLPLTTLMASALMTLALGSAAPAFSEQAPARAGTAPAPDAAQNTPAPQVLLPMVAPAVNPMIIPGAPVRNVTLPFADVAPTPGAITLRGIQPNGQIEFGVRSDEVVTQSTLNLEFTPSPSLIPVQSHLKVYLNDQLMGVEVIDKDQLGKKNHLQMVIDPRYITDFNRIRLEFIGHYQNVCENPANTTLWLEIGKGSSLSLQYQKLPLSNDLAHFPVPFFDARDSRPLDLPMVFAASPDASQQQAAAILASWFGAKAQWRGQSFPTLYNQLPDSHAVVFATNDKRPDFLKDMPPVKGPVVQMVSRADNPYVKMLLILGRDDNDLLTAVKGISQGNILFRGETISVDNVDHIQPRQPYDAPNWVRTDRPMNFGELKQYAEQLQSDGLQPNPITMNINLPPDLFLINSTGIDMRLKYRYTSPQLKNTSRLSISLNNQFVQDLTLKAGHDEDSQLLHLSLLQGLLDGSKDLNIPALKLGAVNQMRFDFDYTSLLASGMEGRCETYTTVPNHVVIDDSSTIDFSGYRHFMAMPDLRAFANAGFPFSRMADLSQTLLLVQPQPQPVQLTTLLDAMGNIGALTGYPSLGVSLTEDAAKAKTTDADLLVIGNLPAGMRDDTLRDDKKANLLLDAARDAVNTPIRQAALPDNTAPASDARVDTSTQISAQGPIAAIVGLQSPYFDQRSVVALMANSQKGFEMLNTSMQDAKQRAQVFGSVTVVRDSGVSSLKVGDTYYVGHLPWWERVWNALANHPALLALMAVIVVILAAILLWTGLRSLARRRLSDDDQE
ncbi:cellulose biosynthesis cyclic di-GMP-binding regulatory protein BcsB [Rahnella laticis]|uniref:cellulose biosynthesis cyclic di-GMP-binding regulatory protein BcsB n=1 Tax=Rahnella laticis TaxID=2787622 RepID=UPI0018A2960A|nr:cellulose biosynthesis cyclic di-GMP-binding regulatory protein BcsB [Rahnella laticis]MBF7993859.1 cellulose biosynthesis cyclic di-GMP-binding regulatory protein BcsB [Rahnella laticis]